MIKKGKQDSSINRRDKREISPTRSVGSGGYRLRKKRKANGEGFFKGNDEELIFNQGKPTGKKCEGKKKVTRRSVTKATNVASKTVDCLVILR
nr:glycosyltransferase family 92 [Tanacetum cinerariifolium]